METDILKRKTARRELQFIAGRGDGPQGTFLRGLLHYENKCAPYCRLSPARQMAPESSERNLEKIIRTADVMQVTGLSKTTIWRRCEAATFLCP